MPRKSAASLSVVSSIMDHRPPPPEELTEEQAVEWRAVVGTMPADWFTRESHGLLTNYCRHLVTARKLSKEIDAFDQEWLHTAEGIVAYDKLTKMRDREARGAASLAIRMRICQAQRYRVEKRVKTTEAAKPWHRPGATAS
jgi:hypothetical protein